MVDTGDLKSPAERRAGSSPASGTTYADVMELVYVLVLEAKFCEFESHHPHQVLGYLQQISLRDCWFDSNITHDSVISLMVKAID